jgi:predicted transcriptional regulator
MFSKKLTKLELQIMDALWLKGTCSVREIHETFPVAIRPAYTTVQTTVYRLEEGLALHQADQQCQYLRGSDLARGCATTID